jgi:hypothetical protein
MYLTFCELAVVFLIAQFSCNTVARPSVDTVPNGVWGGKGIQLTVKDSGAAVDYGCESGTIDEPLRTDSRGKFSVRGTHVFGSGGPRDPGAAAPKPHSARYEGVRNGDTIQLTVYLPDLDRKVGEFTLELGKRPALERCG